jgi:hypothetical protein
MTYNKPEAVKLDGALSAIQGTKKGSVTVLDGIDHDGTPNAYESDD